MKRWFALLAVVLMLTACMTGCGKSKEEEARDKVEDALDAVSDLF